MGYMTIYGYINGESDYMLAPIMPGKLVCGHSTGVVDYPVLYVPNLKEAIVPDVNEYFTYGTCAKKCPSGPDSTMHCFDQDECDSYTPYDTNEVLNYCLPTASSIANVADSDADKNDFTTSSYFISMYEARWTILTSIAISLVIALVYLKLMDWFAVCFAWITIIVIEICLVVLGYFCYAYS